MSQSRVARCFRCHALVDVDVPHTCVACEAGRKDDGADGNQPRKLRWSLVPWGAMAEVVEVLMFGADKYSDNNWRYVENARERYADAFVRHAVAPIAGEWLDPETKKPHYAHAICCGLFLIALGKADT